MNLRILFVLLFVFAAAGELTAQQSAAEIPLHVKNVILPKRAAWIERYARSTSETNARDIAEIHTLIFDGERYSETRFSDGTKSQTWVAGTIMATLDTIEGREEISINDSRTDQLAKKTGREFPGLEYISAETFRGEVKYAGIACWHFSQEKVFSPENAPPHLRNSEKNDIEKREVWIDMKSLLPVARSINGKEIVYYFHPVPAGPASMPIQVQTEIKNYKKAMARYFPDTK